jgi:hypothetical protein
MNKQLFWLLPFLVVAIACRTTKKVTTIQTAITKKDTTQVVAIKEARKDKVDSAEIVKGIMSKVKQQQVDFTTFSAKIKTYYESSTDNQNLTIYMQMKKDSVIILKLVGSFLGITKEAYVVKVTKDSVIVVDKLHNVVQFRSLSYLQEVTQIPFDFRTLQDMFIGNPIFVDSNVVSYRDGEDKLSVLMVGKLFKHLVSLDKADYKPLHSKLDDVDPMRNRTCDISFSRYENKGNFNFSTYREISVAEKSKLSIWMDYKQYAFNEPLTYTLEIPKKYKRK